MYKWAFLVTLILSCVGLAWAQNVMCPDRPNGDNTNACANTRYVLANGGGGGITQLTGDVTAGPGSGSQAATLAWISRAGGKTLTINNSLTFAGTDATTMTFPSTNGTIATLNLTNQAVTGGARVTSVSQSTGNLTLDPGAGPGQFITNNGPWTLTAPSNDGFVVLLVTNGASAGATTLSGFSPNTCGGDAVTTTNTSKFFYHVERINGISTCSVRAGQ